MTLAALTGSRLWLVAGWTMLHFFWVGGALGLAAAAVRRALRRAGPEARYGLALACLMTLAMAPPGIGWLVTVSALPGVPRVEALTRARAPRLPLPAARPVRSASPSARGIAPTVAGPGPIRPTRETGVGPFLARAATFLPWLWLAGAPATFALLGLGLIGAERLRRQSHLLTEGEIVDLCHRLADALRITRPVAMGICDRLVTPIVMGVVRPMILLPPAALTGWSPELVEMALLHELAHVRRLDLPINFAQRVVESILFFHPAVWVVSSWVRQEREHCCDQLVVARTGRPRAYAEALVSLLDPAPISRAPALAMARNPLVTRIRRILEPEILTMRWPHSALALVIALLLIPALLVGAQFTAPPGPRDQEPPKSLPTYSRLTPEQIANAPVLLVQLGDHPVGLMGGRYAQWTLLNLPQVQEELKLTSEQKARLKSTMDEVHRRRERIEQEYRERRTQAVEQGDLKADFQLVRARQQSMGAWSRGADEVVPAKVLDRRQRTRLEQIHAQAEGASVFSRPEIQERLNLAPEQNQAIEEIDTEGNRASKLATVLPAAAVPRNFRQLSAEERKAMVESKAYGQAVQNARDAASRIRTTTMRRILRLLSKGQRERYQKLVGEPFDFTKTSSNALLEAAGVRRSGTSSSN